LQISEMRLGLIVIAIVVLVSLNWHFTEKNHTEYLPCFEENRCSFQSVSAPFVKLYTIEWLVEKPKAQIFIVHGFGEHIQRYNHTAQALNQAGFNVYGLDHQGHGLSGGDRVHVKNFNDYARDYIEFIHSKKSSQLQTILLGHSMGGLIATQIADMQPEIFTGVILIGPPLAREPESLKTIANVLSRLIPKAPVLGMKVDTSGLINSRSGVLQYENDPLVHHGWFRIGWADSIVQAMDNAFVSAADNTYPLLFLHGVKDSVCKIADSRDFFKLIPETTDKTFIGYEEFFHEILNEPDYMIVINDITTWINTRL